MADWFFRLVKGMLIGIGAILPGISGGVLSLVLGIYKPMMAFFAHPFKAFKQQMAFFIPVFIGLAIGVIALSRAVDWLFRNWETPAIWLFIGLVVGTLPSLFHEAGSKGRPPSAWPTFVVAGLVTGAWMWLISRGSGAAVAPSTLWWVLCGVLWGLGFIVPGMSPSSFFIFFGLYQPMTDAIGSLDLAVILPMALGLGATVVLLARGMNALLARAYAPVMHAILGIVIASTIAILPLQAGGAGEILLYAACFAAGCAIAYAVDRLGKRFPEKSL